jgi:hypothetical protein
MTDHDINTLMAVVCFAGYIARLKTAMEQPTTDNIMLASFVLLLAVYFWRQMDKTKDKDG